MTELFRFVLARPAEVSSEGIVIIPHLSGRSFKYLKNYIVEHTSNEPPSLQYRKQIDTLGVKLKEDEYKAEKLRPIISAIFDDQDVAKITTSEVWKSDKKKLDGALAREYAFGEAKPGSGAENGRRRQLYDVVDQAVASKRGATLKFKPLIIPVRKIDKAEDDSNDDSGRIKFNQISTRALKASEIEEHRETLAALKEVAKLLNSKKAFDNVDHSGEGKASLWLNKSFLDELSPSGRSSIQGFFNQDKQELATLYNWVLAGLKRERAALKQETFKKGLFAVGPYNIPLSKPWPGPLSAEGPTDVVLNDQFLPFTPVPSIVRPTGVGDLLVVREHVWGYEGGEIGSIQNVLKSEILIRDTSRMTRTELVEFSSESLETTEERDTSSTERFSLTQEASNLIKTDAGLESKLSTSAKYGPTVEVKADLSVAMHESQEASNKIASQFSKDVTSRAASKVVEKTFRSTSLTTISQFEDKFKHEFQNGGSNTENITGLYQWINKISQCQMYNYGKRLLMDIIVPEPAAFLMSAASSSGPRIAEPPELVEAATDLDESNYAEVAARYNAVGVKAPPTWHMSFSKSFRQPGENKDVTQPKHDDIAAIDIAIPKGYVAWSYTLATDHIHGDLVDGGPDKNLFKADCTVDGKISSTTTTGVVVLEAPFPSTTVSISFATNNYVALSGTIRLNLARMPETFAKWQLETYDAIATAYTKARTEWLRSVAESVSTSFSPVTGNNPLENTAIIRTELKKSCISMLSAQNFDGFGSIKGDSYDIPQIDNYAVAAAQGRYIQFIEQAFEWENLQYELYPYFWGRKELWANRVGFQAPDGKFADFVKAGAARVSLPARLGFSREVLHFLETGDPWLSTVVSEEYQHLANEIADAEKTAGKEKLQGDPWFTVVPTSLVRLRKDDKLPEFEFDAKTELWVEVDRRKRATTGSDEDLDQDDDGEDDVD